MRGPRRAWPRARYAGPDQHDQQVDRDDFERQQVRAPACGLRSAEDRGERGAGSRSSTPRNAEAQWAAPGAVAWLGRCRRAARQSERHGAAIREKRQHAVARPDAEFDPLGAHRLHADERPLRREHDAEDDQHERAADVDDQLRGADEVGAPSRKKMPAVPAGA